MAQPEPDDIESLMAKKRRELEAEIAAKSGARAGSNIVELTDANFDTTLSRNKVMLVDFWAPWCGPCRWVSPVLEQIARENVGKLVLGKLNVDENPRTSQRFGVQGIPTIMVAQNGRIVDQVVGAMPKEDLDEFIRPYLTGSN